MSKPVIATMMYVCRPLNDRCSEPDDDAEDDADDNDNDDSTVGH